MAKIKTFTSLDNSTVNLSAAPVEKEIVIQEKIVYVDKIVEVPKEVIKEVEKLVYVDKPVEVIKKIHVPIEVPVEKHVEKIVEKIVTKEVPVEIVKIMEVPKLIIREKVSKWAILAMAIQTAVILGLILT
jgi:hypothetical protein